jgi:3D (Asp-Asp-Asp) domain-containing protein
MVEHCNHIPVFSRLVTAVCLTTVFQFTACAQGTKPEAQETVNQPEMNSAQAPTETRDMVCEPKVTLLQPNVEVAIAPHEQKLHAVKFSEPEVQHPQAPRQFKASAYSINGRTRSGVKTQQGVLAADPRVLPLGTVVQVNAGKYSGVYTVCDTGGAIKGNRVDVWLSSYKEARLFGRRNVKLVVLKYPGQNKPGK